MSFIPSAAYIPHGHCYLWQPTLVSLHVIADSIIAIAYLSIPLTLIFFIRRRRDVPYPWVFALFSAFIISCGLTHLMAIWTLWHPAYWFSGALKAVTAFVSMLTAIVLLPVVPQVIALPSADELKKLNQNLQKEIRDRSLVEASLRRYERIVATTSDAVALIDSHFVHQITNDAYQHYYNSGTTNIVGQPMATIVGEANFTQRIRPHLEACFAGKTVQRETWFDFPSQKGQFIRTTYTPYREIDGTITGTVVNISNLTDLVHAQQALTRRIAQEHLINTIACRIHQSLDLDHILSTTVSEVRQFLSTDRVIVYRFEPDLSGVVIVESAAPDIVPLLHTSIDDPCFKASYIAVYQQGRIQMIDDIHTATLEECHRQLLARYQVRANLVVPVLQGECLWGLLIAHHCREARHWEEFEVGLLSKLATQVGIAIQQSELYGQIQHLATVDGLTQIANRRRFDEYLEEVWQSCREQDTALSLILADIDFFKQYNDTYGHPAGDRCLKTIATLLVKTTERFEGLVSRYGGEEFAILLPEMSQEQAMAIAEELRVAVSAAHLEHPTSMFGCVTLSLGIAHFSFLAEKTPKDLISWADQALYQSKNKGRNSITLQTAAPNLA